MYEEVDVNSLLVQITDRCNLNCKHCFLSGGKPGEMSVDALEKIIKEAVEFKIEEIMLTGGEPLIHKEIHQIFGLIDKYSQINFGIITNGTMLNKPIMKEIEQKENVYIQISFDGSVKEIYEQIRGEGNFEKFWNGLELIAASKVKDKRTRTAVSVINYNDVERICKIAHENGMAPSFFATVKMGNANTNWGDLQLSDIQKMKVNNIIRNFNRQHGTGIRVLTPPALCCFSIGESRKSFNVNTRGDVYVCDFLNSFPIGNLFIEKFDSILRGEHLQRLYEMGKERCRRLEADICSQCEVKSECHYGCPAEAMNAGDIYGCDMHCHYRKLFYSCMAANLI